MYRFPPPVFFYVKRKKTHALGTAAPIEKGSLIALDCFVDEERDVCTMALALWHLSTLGTAFGLLVSAPFQFNFPFLFVSLDSAVKACRADSFRSRHLETMFCKAICEVCTRTCTHTHTHTIMNSILPSLES